MIVVGDRLAAIYDAVETKLPPGLVSWWFRYVDPRFRKFFAAKAALKAGRVPLVGELRQVMIDEVCVSLSWWICGR